MSRFSGAGIFGVSVAGPPPGGVVLDDETFGSGFGIWTTPGGNDPETAWLRTSGATPTASAGPIGGSNPATRAADPANFYAYTEASPASDTTWSLESPEIDASLGTTSLEFDLFMKFGSVGGILDGTLIVQGWNGSAWSQIDASIVGSKQTSDSQAWKPSSDFGTYDSSGFSNVDFHFRFLAAKGVDPLFANYDFCVDNVKLTGPSGALTGGSGPGSDVRSGAFTTGLRRLHVSKGGAPPLDGSTPDLSFSTIQAALNVMIAGDVITVGAGEYDERPAVSNKAGTVANPIWIAAEVLGAVTISNFWQAAKNGTVTWTLQNGSTGRYSATHGDTYMGSYLGQWLPVYSSTAVLDAATVNGKNRPDRGLAVSGGSVHIRLENNENPNGKSILITDLVSGNIVDFTNCDNVIFDGFICEGGGEQSGVDFDVNCANPTVTNCQTSFSRFMCRIGSDAIVDWCDYRMDGCDQWMRDVVSLNGGERAAFFDIIKGDMATGGNATYEGAIAVGAGAFGSAEIHSDSEFSFNRCFGVFDAFGIGDYQDSDMHHNIMIEIGDDGVSMEDPRTDNEGDGCRVYFNKFVNPHAPVLSHQQDQLATHFVIRNVVQITEPGIFQPQFLIKTIRTFNGSTIRHAHWYIEHFGSTGTRSPWYPFNTPASGNEVSGGDEITDFLNNIVVYTGGISPDPDVQSGGFPGNIDGNCFAGPAAESGLQGTNGVFAGTDKADVEVNADFTLQSTSPARGIGQSLPGGFVDPITDAGANDDAGAFPFGFDPGSDWPRPDVLTFNTATLPSRWTSPG